MRTVHASMKTISLKFPHRPHLRHPYHPLLRPSMLLHEKRTLLPQPPWLNLRLDHLMLPPHTLMYSQPRHCVSAAARLRLPTMMSKSRLSRSTVGFHSTQLHRASRPHTPVMYF